MHLPAILGAWGLPPDKAAWGALAAAVFAIAIACAPPDGSHRLDHLVQSRRVAFALAFVAALFSLAYIAFYLGGGPRIVDATTYFLQGRALAEGHFAWHVPEPGASFRGRFLVGHAPYDAIAGIFPPGYPLLLSLGFAVGAPLVVGPVLGALIVIATWGLARELAREAGLDRHGVETVSRTAACLSVVCAALRYHTADTMAHGACALAFTLAIYAAIRARREGLPWFFLLAGIPLGFVIATRFASALALGVVLGWLAVRAPAKKTSLLACALGAIPGVLLLVIAQSATTGHALGSAQSAYYAASDGPPGCFRYGFGAAIGCLVEHGDFVRARGVTSGYGFLAALGVTARRLRMHTEDVANFEPLFLLVLVPFLKAKSASSRPVGMRACGAVVVAIIVAYAPFYFDGDYPGGGARFFADVLPIEHALIALGVAFVAKTSGEIGRAGAATLALAFLGFSVHAVHDHEQLRARDGGHPMFDPEVLATRSLDATSTANAANANKTATPPPASLVFIDTDHGFALAHDPEKADRAAEAIAKGEKPSGVIVARQRSDDHDRLIYERLGRPSAWVYHFIPDSPKTLAQAERLGHDVAFGDLQPWSPPAPGTWAGGAETWRFESENEWPPLAQTGSAWAEPIWATNSCASPTGTGRALAIHGTGAGSVVLDLPIPRAGIWRVTPRIVLDPGAAPRARAIEVRAPDGAVLARWEGNETVATEPAPAPNPNAKRRGPGLGRPGESGGPGAGTTGGPDVPTKTCVDAPGKSVAAKDAAGLRLVIETAPETAAKAAEAGEGPEGREGEWALDRVLLSPTSR